MTKLTRWFASIALFTLATTASAATTMHKCVANGSVTYQQAPCAVEQNRAQPTIEELNALEKKKRAAAPSAPTSPSAPAASLAPAPAPISFRCDGRQYCSQMTSCAEAKYFLANCPNTKMDGHGHGDGIPCQKQWCTQ